MLLILKRLIQLIPTLIGVSLLTFFIMRMTPGDPVRNFLGPEATPDAVERLRIELGMDKPLWQQYLDYLGINPLPPGPGRERRSGVFQGDFGKSLTSGRPVWDEIKVRLPATIELAVLAMFFATLTGMLVGTLSAVYPRSFLDNASRFFVFIFLAMPSFWLGLELIIIVSRHLQWFPPGERGEPWFPWFNPYVNLNLSHLFLPALTLGVSTGAFLCRILRSSMLQVLNQDFIRTARAKGLNKKTIVVKHALKNAMIPFVTVAGLSLGGLLGGSVIVETVFNWPGVGKLFVDSIKERDLPVTMGCVLILATVFVLINLAVDLLYVALDPRIRLEDERA